MTVELVPWAIDGLSHYAYTPRQLTQAIFGGPVAAHVAAVGATAGGAHGVIGTGLAVTQRGAGANMSVDVAAGQAIIRSGGTDSLNSGCYSLFNNATLNVVISAADATNPRIDLVVAQVRDNNFSEAASDARIVVITGTPAASPAVPSLTLYPNCVVLAQIAVAAAAGSIVTANITDKRTYASAVGGVLYVELTASLPTGIRPGTIAWDAQAVKLKRVGADGSTWADVDSNKVLQMINTQTGALATGATAIPYDDTIPQNTEGDQYMTLAITPTNAASTLLIDVVALVSPAGSDWITCALFQDSTAGALAAAWYYETTAQGSEGIVLRHKMTAGATSATTFKVRMGRATANTMTFNGQASARRMGGVAASSITITEIAP